MSNINYHRTNYQYCQKSKRIWEELSSELHKHISEKHRQYILKKDEEYYKKHNISYKW